MKTGIVLLAMMLVGACASVPVPSKDQLFDDRLFAQPSQLPNAAAIFAVSDEMKRYLNTTIAAESAYKGAKQGLFDALYDRDQLQLEYDSAVTRNAAEAFAARAGNCLSLAIMTAAFAKEMGLTVTYQQPYVDEAWGRTGDVYLMIGHVNLTLGQRLSDAGSRLRASETLTIDFLPTAQARALRSRVLGESTIVAMYMNNRSVELMSSGDLNAAYWWVREAIAQDPSFISAYNTLGTVYYRHGDLAHAEAALRYVVAREPKNTQAMANLVPVLTALGRAGEARELNKRLAEIDPDPPFSFYIRGVIAMRTGDFRLAKSMFAREVARAPEYHEFHFWLASAYAALGEDEQARREMALAIEYSPTRGDRELYASKLAKINAHRSP